MLIRRELKIKKFLLIIHARLLMQSTDVILGAISTKSGIGMVDV
jgi:hypothetical protein